MEERNIDLDHSRAHIHLQPPTAELWHQPGCESQPGDVATMPQSGGRGVPAHRAGGTGAELQQASSRQWAPAPAQLLWACHLRSIQWYWRPKSLWDLGCILTLNT